MIPSELVWACDTIGWSLRQ